MKQYKNIDIQTSEENDCYDILVNDEEIGQIILMIDGDKPSLPEYFFEPDQCYSYYTEAILTDILNFMKKLNKG